MKLKNFLKFNKSPQAQAGFSLIEIIIVIAIIGTLMGIIIARLTGGADNAKAGITDTKAFTLQSKLIQYQLATGKFPTSEQGLQVLLSNSGAPIAAEDDLKDGWGNEFNYSLTPKGPYISSNGSEGAPNSPTSLCYLNGKKVDCNPAAPNVPK
ncbi:type II secretion system protein GspG [Spirobacillus cienkowskii]|jgi:general secretion pathway protein G|uniref:Prepilin-type N-terminal cleavage/methylation domain-containing protein n=1 Tax=Spirobacillus cienkowskii TaxID=495820 RepID=A0A369KVE0_9BACT|nr:MAG: prepilin-type N-terminal cleavage/methylation domain-containing protein [Spirobacillus cienkowskii]